MAQAAQVSGPLTQAGSFMEESGTGLAGCFPRHRLPLSINYNEPSEPVGHFDTSPGFSPADTTSPRLFEATGL